MGYALRWTFYLRSVPVHFHQCKQGNSQIIFALSISAQRLKDVGEKNIEKVETQHSVTISGLVPVSHFQGVGLCSKSNITFQKEGLRSRIRAFPYQSGVEALQGIWRMLARQPSCFQNPLSCYPCRKVRVWLRGFGISKGLET